MTNLKEVFHKLCTKCAVGHMNWLNYCDQLTSNHLDDGHCRHNFNIEHHTIQCDICHYMIYDVNVA